MLYDNSILSKLCIQYSVITHYKLCSLWSQSFWSLCCLFLTLYWCLSRQSIVSIWLYRFAQSLDGIICKTNNSLHSVSVGNGSGWPTSGPGSDWIYWLVRFQNRAKTPTRSILAGYTWTRTRQPAGFAMCGETCQFRSPVQCFGIFYLWSDLDTLLLITKYWLSQAIVPFGCIDRLYP